jgi:hypothetical protein
VRNYERFKAYRNPGVPEDWEDSVIVLWEADDATLRDPDAETAVQAFIRIWGFDPTSPRGLVDEIAKVDLGDTFLTLYRGGQVLICDYAGGGVGVLIKARSNS